MPCTRGNSSSPDPAWSLSIRPGLFPAHCDHRMPYVIHNIGGSLILIWRYLNWMFSETSNKTLFITSHLVENTTCYIPLCNFTSLSQWNGWLFDYLTTLPTVFIIYSALDRSTVADDGVRWCNTKCSKVILIRHFGIFWEVLRKTVSLD